MEGQTWFLFFGSPSAFPVVSLWSPFPNPKNRSGLHRGWILGPLGTAARVPRKSSLSDRSNSASPRRSVSITEPVASPQPSSPREPPSGPRWEMGVGEMWGLEQKWGAFREGRPKGMWRARGGGWLRRSLDQRLRAAEMALDSPLTPAPGPAARPSSASSGWSLEERMGRLEQRLAQEAEARGRFGVLPQVALGDVNVFVLCVSVSVLAFSWLVRVKKGRRKW